MFNKKKIYTSILIVTVLICLFGFVWSWFVTKDVASIENLAAAQNQRVSVNNLVLTETKDEIVYWELYAKTGSYDSAKGYVVLNDVVGNFYDKDQKVAISFESPRGAYQESEKIITLEGETLIVARDGSSIQADKIVWKGRDEDIVASGNVVVRRNDNFMSTSERAIFSSDFTNFRIEGKTQTKIFDSREISKE